MTVDPQGRTETIVEVDQQPSGLGWTPDGHLLVVSMLDRRLLRLEDGELVAVAGLAALATGPCNDMVVDAAGRAYVGNFGEPPQPTCIVRVDPGGHAVVAADELSFPNGTVITADGKTLLVAETFAHRLTAFDVGEDGRLSNRRVFAELQGCFPDGICLDAEGAIWVADAGGRRVVRVSEGGQISQTISTGDRNAYACMLGGPDRQTLFICTCTGSGPDVAEKTAGQIGVVQVDVPGAGLP